MRRDLLNDWMWGSGRPKGISLAHNQNVRLEHWKMYTGPGLGRLPRSLNVGWVCGIQLRKQ